MFFGVSGGRVKLLTSSFTSQYLVCCGLRTKRSRSEQPVSSEDVSGVWLALPRRRALSTNTTLPLSVSLFHGCCFFSFLAHWLCSSIALLISSCLVSLSGCDFTFYCFSSHCVSLFLTFLPPLCSHGPLSVFILIFKLKCSVFRVCMRSRVLWLVMVVFTTFLLLLAFLVTLKG